MQFSLAQLNTNIGAVTLQTKTDDDVPRFVTAANHAEYVARQRRRIAAIGQELEHNEELENLRDMGVSGRAYLIRLARECGFKLRLLEPAAKRSLFCQRQIGL